MRPVLIAATLAVLAQGPALAQWKTFTYKSLGVEKEFPGTPTVKHGTYTTPLVKNAHSTTFSLTKDGNILRLVVVDLKGREADGANILGEAIASYISGRDVTYTLEDVPLYDKGFNSVYGIVMHIQKPDGSRMITNTFFNKGRLYKVEVIVPATSLAKSSPDFARFVNGVQFHLQGYGFDFSTGHDYPIGDDNPNDRDTRVIPHYKPPPGYEHAGKVPAADTAAAKDQPQGGVQ